MGLLSTIGKIGGGLLGSAVGMPGLGVAVGGALGGALGGGGAGKASKAAQQAAAQNAQLIRDQWGRADALTSGLTPYAGQAAGALAQRAGINADGSYNPDAGFTYGAADYTSSPGFQFQLDQGLDAITARAAAGGYLRSGAAMKGITDYAQNLAMRDFQGERAFAAGRYDTQTNNLNGLANFGMGAINANLNAGQQMTQGLLGTNNQVADAVGNSALIQQGQNMGLLGSIIGGLGQAKGGGGSSGAPAIPTSYGTPPIYGGGYNANIPIGSGWQAYVR